MTTLGSEGESAGRRADGQCQTDRLGAPSFNVPYVDHFVLVVWVAENTDIDLRTVDTVLTVEWEYMVGSGIATGGVWEFRYYDPCELAGAPRAVDSLRIARDAERLADIPAAVGLRVLAGELEYLQMRGLAPPPRPR